MDFLQDLANPPKANNKTQDGGRIPTITSRDFQALGDKSLDTYLDRIPRNEWIPILKSLLVGFGATALGGLTYVMGKYVQWLKENKGEGRVKSTDPSSWSSRAGATAGKGVAAVLSAPESVMKGLSKGVKATGMGARLALHLMRTSKPKTLSEKIRAGINSFGKFRETE